MKVIELPYEYRKYITVNDKEKILLVRIKSDDPKYHRGKIPKGSKIKKDIKNTRSDAESSIGVKKRYVRKNMDDISGGFLGKLINSIPLVGPLFTGIFGFGDIGSGYIGGGIFSVEKLKELKKNLTKKTMSFLMDKYNINKKKYLTRTKKLFSDIINHAIKNKGNMGFDPSIFIKKFKGGELLYGKKESNAGLFSIPTGRGVIEKEKLIPAISKN